VTARERLRRARAVLGASVVLSALLWGAAATGLLLVGTAIADWLVPLPGVVRQWMRAAALLAGLLVISTVLRRGRRVRSEQRVALWLEEHEPALGYALVTLVDPAARDVGMLERSVAGIDWRPTIRRASMRALAPPALLAAVAAVLLLALPRGVVARVGTPKPGDALDRPATRGADVDPLSPLVVRVAPPAYAGEPERVLEDPTSVAALIGSRVAIEGPGARDIDARLGERTLSVVPRGPRWSVLFSMPARPQALRLRADGRERLLVLEPRADSAPTVGLLALARDTVLRAPTGTIPFAARAVDDLGLAAGWLEVIVSSGEGETFTFRSATLGRRSFGGSRQAELRAALRIDSLGLGAGDVVHVRAVARDANAVSGPGTGASETRTIRIARVGEYDSVAVEGAAPPEADKSEVSQRMLIVLAEALERRRPRLERETVLGESRRIGVDQARLRRRVSEIVFIRLEEGEGGEHSHHADDQRGSLTPEELLAAAEEATAEAQTGEALDFAEDESPVVAINRPLLEAYNAMWDAGRELDVGEPGRALPHMRAALDAIQRARAAERIYLRGRPPVAVVDLQNARLAGDRADAAPRARASRAPPDDPLVRLGVRLDAALELLSRSSDAAVDSLLLLRVEALEGAPSLAAALGEAVEELRRGRDASEALARARRATLGEPVARGGIPRWGGAW
jgi:hypothetical protein